MPPAPAVRDLQSLVATQNAALQPQYDLIDQGIAANETSGNAQQAGLDQAKTNAFGEINQDSSNKGMFFSGFSPNEQGKYLGSTYLPAVAQLASTIAGARASLLGKKADLGKGAYDVATQQHEDDLKTLADWNKMNADEQFQASQADKDRAFTAQQNVLNRSAASAGVSTSDKLAADIGGANAFLQPLKGADNRVSPQSYAQAKSIWVGEGYSGASFDKQFAAYRNPNNKSYKLG